MVLSESDCLEKYTLYGKYVLKLIILPVIEIE